MSSLLRETRATPVRKSSDMLDVELSDFEASNILGSGTYGKVFKARLPNQGKTFAIKVVRKDKLAEHNLTNNASLELQIMNVADHPSLLNLNYFFQTEERLFYVMPFYKYGSLGRLHKSDKDN